MLYALSDDERRIRPIKTGERAMCPCCRAPVMSRCGRIKVWHWAHVNAECDSWAEPESDWHLEWKMWFTGFGYEPEVVITHGETTHRADLAKTDAEGVVRVIELQHSSIPLGELKSRELFYNVGRMAWLFDARKACTKKRLEIEPFGESPDGSGARVRFQWPRMPTYIHAARAPIFLHVECGEGAEKQLVHVHELPRRQGWGRGILDHAAKFVDGHQWVWPQ